MLSRMKYIDRWGLMRNTRQENLCEHSFETAVIAFALASLRNIRFGGSVSPERAATLALFHDCAEILTGDLPTPVKYHNLKIRAAYGEVEREAEDRLLSLLPADLRPPYGELMRASRDGDGDLALLVKAADKISALIKCVEERRAGNREFESAEESLRRAIGEMNVPEAALFLREFLPAYSLTLDDASRGPKSG